MDPAVCEPIASGTFEPKRLPSQPASLPPWETACSRRSAASVHPSVARERVRAGAAKAVRRAAADELELLAEAELGDRAISVGADAVVGAPRRVLELLVRRRRARRLARPRRVHGLGGLRVVDCSIMPTPVSGNTNGPAMAVAERAAELWAWFQDGAHFYVCGDAARMAKDVDTLVVIVPGGAATATVTTAARTMRAPAQRKLRGEYGTRSG